MRTARTNGDTPAFSCEGTHNRRPFRFNGDTPASRAVMTHYVVHGKGLEPENTFL